MLIENVFVLLLIQRCEYKRNNYCAPNRKNYVDIEIVDEVIHPRETFARNGTCIEVYCSILLIDGISFESNYGNKLLNFGIKIRYLPQKRFRLTFKFYRDSKMFVYFDFDT